MNGLDEASAQQSAGAAERVAMRTGQRRERIDAIVTGRLVTADEPIRIAARIELSGPVFAADDDQYRGIQLPRQFWKWSP